MAGKSSGLYSPDNSLQTLLDYWQSATPSLSNQKFPLFVTHTIPALPDMSGGDVGNPKIANLDSGFVVPIPTFPDFSKKVVVSPSI